ncbi:MFS transporter [Nostocaceae cyanobacterium CENA369]|uniref:MFS transporter n=1 Tax=Dendronalium phyllosphericum CENA369 TaxID=1725256 RepID=A0A8J7IA64_9NOST|nr:MFS transporter [Dendronalium phyllosphericum]MBH8576948.1 MFS transporter [Dendronalium phyllosphericum CENA369]
MVTRLASGRQSLLALDWLNVFLADIQGGVGPFLVVYLTSSLHWNPAEVGLVMTISGLAGVIAQTPAGALIDRVRQKRSLIVMAAVLIAISSIATIAIPTFSVIAAAQSLTAIAGAFFGPTIAAISLGLVGRQGMDRRIGRNQTLSSAGNVVAALLAGLIGHFVGQAGIFCFIALMSLAVIFCALKIRKHDIDYRLSRGGDDSDRQVHVSKVTNMWSDRRLLIFAICAVLFHFANAAMLPLVGEMLAHHKGGSPALFMSACIITAQLVMVPLGILVGQRASRSQRKPIFLLAFLALPIRGVLYTLSDNSFFLVSVQLLDGIGAGIFGVMQLLVIADLTKGTGHFNLAQGAIGAAVGIGASLSNYLAGYVAKEAGYNASFLSMAAIAASALAFFWFFMPETKSTSHAESSQSELSTLGE